MFHPLFDLRGRVALVTGAARGLGRAMAIALAEVGSDLLLADVNEAGMADTAVLIETHGRRAIRLACDVSDCDQIEALFQVLDRGYGRLDVLANVAGEGVLAPPQEVTLAGLDQVFNVLLRRRFFMTQQAGRRMLAAGKGSIINIG